VVWVPGCLVAMWWQVTVALAGDRLGYLYSVEWPLFAVFGVVVWWNLVHDDPEATGARALRRLRAAPDRPGLGALERRPEEEDAALAAYNDYLAELARRDAAGRR